MIVSQHIGWKAASEATEILRSERPIVAGGVFLDSVADVEHAGGGIRIDLVSEHDHEGGAAIRLDQTSQCAKGAIREATIEDDSGMPAARGRKTQFHAWRHLPCQHANFTLADTRLTAVGPRKSPRDWRNGVGIGKILLQLVEQLLHQHLDR